MGRAAVELDLANLCHHCGACLHACQYAAPHEFAVDVPQAMAQVRGETYAGCAWPTALGALYRRNGLTVALAVAMGLAPFLVLALALTGSLIHEPRAGDVYAVFPHNLLAAMFGSVFVFALLALALGVRRFWRDGAAAGRAPGRGDGTVPDHALRQVRARASSAWRRRRTGRSRSASRAG